MINQYIDVVRDDVYRLLCKKGRASDSEYLAQTSNTLKEELNNERETQG